MSIKDIKTKNKIKLVLCTNDNINMFFVIMLCQQILNSNQLEKNINSLVLCPTKVYAFAFNFS